MSFRGCPGLSPDAETKPKMGKYARMIQFQRGALWGCENYSLASARRAVSDLMRALRIRHKSLRTAGISPL